MCWAFSRRVSSLPLRAGPDVVGHGRTIRVWLPAYVVLSLAGAALLVITPGEVFDRIVPYLVASDVLSAVRFYSLRLPLLLGLNGLRYFGGRQSAGSPNQRARWSSRSG